MKKVVKGMVGLLIALIITGCAKQEIREVVVYTCLDQIYSEPILQEFEKKTGIKVKAIYDTEATKTTGMVNRLIAEKNNPQCDVFWNNEVGRTIILKEKGVITSYHSPSAKDIPAQFKDSDGYWVGFAARARVIIYNTELVKDEEAPKSIFDLTLPKWKGEAAIANPLFGTTLTHAAALFQLLGEEKAKRYFADLKANEVVIVDGNSVVRDQVADGELKCGLTDTDDANGAIEDGKPVKVVYPDKDGIGTLVIPNTVSLVAGCPHPEEGKQLIDYLLSPEVEEKLAHCRSVQIPLHPGVKTPAKVLPVESIKAMEVGFEEIASKIEPTAKYLQRKFID
ncbi:MAG: extracellular solute-binding protein [bacterium]